MKVFNHPTLGDISLSSVLQAVADPCRQKIIATLLKAEGRALACNEFYQKPPLHITLKPCETPESLRVMRRE
jgi:hypothetical protein